MALVLVCFVPGSSSQDEDPTIRELVAKLGSSDVGERVAATKKLKALGSPAIPELRKTADGTDPESAARARLLLRIFEIRDQLPAALRAAAPDLEDRLAAGGPPAWTETFIAFSNGSSKGAGPRDLDALVLKAIEGARTPTEKCEVLKGIGDHRIRQCVATILTWLKDDDALVRLQTLGALQQLHASHLAGELLPAMKDPDESVREHASELLAEWGRPDCISALLEALRDKSDRVRWKTVGEMWRFETPQVAAAVVPLLKDESDVTRRSAAQALGRLRPVVPVGDIVPLLEHSRSEVRASAAYALAESRAVQTIDALRKRLDDPDSEAQGAVVQALVRLEGRRFVPDLLRLLQRDNAVRSDALDGLRTLNALDRISDPGALFTGESRSFRSRAAFTLAELQVDEVVPELLRAVEDKNKHTREAAALILCRYPTAEVRSALSGLLKDSQPEGRMAAADALWAMKAENSRAAIVALLGDDSIWVRKEGIRRIVRLEPTEGVRRLIPLLSDADADVRREAAVMLGEIAGPTDTADLLKLLAAESVAARRSTLIALAGLRPRDAIPAIARCLADPDGGVRAETVRTLDALGREFTEDEIGRLSSDGDADVRENVARALGEKRPSAGLEVLLRLSDDPDRDVRLQAAEALDKTGGEKAASRLRRLLHDSSFRIRALAARAMGRRSCREAIPELVDLLRDPGPGVVRSALASLRSLRAVEAWRPIVDLLLESEDPSAAASALGELKPPDAGLVLHAALKSEWAQDRERAALTLGRLGAREAIADLCRLLADPESRVRGSAAEALGRLGAREAIPDLEIALATPVGSVRARIVFVLAALGSARGTDEVSQLLERGSSDQRVKAADCAAELRMDAARPALRRFLEDDDLFVVQKGVSVLASMGDRQSISSMVSLLDARFPSYQREVIEGLSQFGEGAWLEDVAKRLQSRFPEVRSAAARILCSAGRREGVPELLERAAWHMSGLLPLNGVRRPEAWKRLRTATLLLEPGLRLLDRIERAAKEAGLSLELSLSPELRDLLGKTPDGDQRGNGERVPAIHVLEESIFDLPLEAIVETDRIRILSRARAVSFWNAEFSK